MDNREDLLSAYFHQDWDHTHSTWEEVVDQFLVDDPTTVAAVPGDYSPTEGDRQWLTAVRDRIQQSSGVTP